MRRAKWLLANAGPPDRIQALSYAAQEVGCEVEIRSIKEMYDDEGRAPLETDSNERACVIFRGSINMSVDLRKSRPNWIGNWHSRDAYLCSHYYSYWGQYITQQRYLILPVAEVLRNWDWLFDTLAQDNLLFIRPNSGEKEFNGELVQRKNMFGWKLVSIETKSTLIDELCVVSTPVEIQKEVRLIIANKRVVAGSVYRLAGMIWHERLEDQHDANDIIAFAEMVLAGLSPPDLPPVHCLDIAVHDSKLSILEVGCFCCCGLYACDLHKIVPAVSDAAEQSFNQGVPTCRGSV